MTLIEHAERELALAGVAGSDDYDGMLYEAVLELIKKFADQGHSGASAAMVTALVEKLMRFEPLTPLTGDPDEWVEVGRDINGRDGVPVFQNKRYSAVFKDGEDGAAYDINAVVLLDRHGGTWGGHGARDPITFPYTPKQQVVEIDQHGRTLNPALERYNIRGFCDDDGCSCWRGGPKIRLDGDSHLTDEEKAAGLDGK